MTRPDRAAEGEVRCKNCVQRFKVEPGTTEMACPHCGVVWIISWPQPNVPYVRRPKEEAE